MNTNTSYLSKIYKDYSNLSNWFSSKDKYTKKILKHEKKKKSFFEQRTLKNELMEIIIIIDVNMGKYFKYSIN